MGGRGWLASMMAVAVVAFWGWVAPADAYVYWANSGSMTIGRANLDGSSPVQGFIAGADNPNGVTVDGRHVYWTNAGTDTIGRANLDGSGAIESFIAGANDPSGVAVDGRHVYWTNTGTDTIGRANLDGSGANLSFIADANNPNGVAVDGQHVYWTNVDTGTIGRANLDGSSVNQGFIAGASFPPGVAVDGEHVYWTNAGPGTIGRANLDGSSVNQGFIAGASTPHGVAVDDRHVYWTNLVATIGRANLDGSGANQSFIAGASSPVGVAVDSGPGSAAASAASLPFGTQLLGTFGAPRSVTITNTGPGNLAIDAARVASGDVHDFLITDDTCSQSTLTIGETCAVHVRFGPSKSGDRRAALTLSSNDPHSPMEIPLLGTAGQLPDGPTGAPGAQGPASPASPAGPAGPASPRGAPGRVRLVTCRRVRVRVRGHRVKRHRCRTRLIRGTAPFTTSGPARASLKRRGVLYATGTLHRGVLVLHTRRRVQAARYTLTLRYRRNGHPLTTSTPITIRGRKH